MRAIGRDHGIFNAIRGGDISIEEEVITGPVRKGIEVILKFK